MKTEVVQVGAINLGLTDSFGQSTVEGLQSLKYRIQTITVCKDATINGTGFSGQSGCITVYEGDNSADYDSFGYEEAKASDVGYVDLMDPEDVKKLSGSLALTSAHVGEYKYGFVNWYKPIKLTQKSTSKPTSCTRRTRRSRPSFSAATA